MKNGKTTNITIYTDDLVAAAAMLRAVSGGPNLRSTLLAAGPKKTKRAKSAKSANGKKPASRKAKPATKGTQSYKIQQLAKKGLSASQVAKKLGINPGTAYHAIHG